MTEQQEYDGWRTRWPDLVVECRTDRATDLLQRYYRVLPDGRPAYTGARFEAVGAFADDPDMLAPADFVAVSMLSVDVPAQAAIRLLERDSSTLSALLSRIPADLDIVDAEPEDLSSRSAAGELWNVLRGGKDGLGRTTTSKLIAVKRPRLIPIWDSRVEESPDCPPTTTGGSSAQCSSPTTGGSGGGSALYARPRRLCRQRSLSSASSTYCCGCLPKTMQADVPYEVPCCVAARASYGAMRRRAKDAPTLGIHAGAPPPTARE